jgi:hypothetical protein
MALSKKVKETAVMRITDAVRQRLESLIFSRYPQKEWGTFFLFGTHQTLDGVVITIVDLSNRSLATWIPQRRLSGSMSLTA